MLLQKKIWTRFILQRLSTVSTNLKEKKRRSGRKNIDWIRMGSIYVMFTLLLLVFFLGTDVSKVPCFRDSFFYSILSGMVVGVSYNLLTSRLDWPCLLRSSFYNSLCLSVSWVEIKLLVFGMVFSTLILSGMVIRVWYNLLTSRLYWPYLLRSSFYNLLCLSVSSNIFLFFGMVFSTLMLWHGIQGLI